MHRIDTDGALPGGLFGDGNPAVGQQGTIFDADWLNDIQENVAQAIEHAGIALVKGDGTQLTQAIIAMIAGVIGAGGGAVPTTRKVLGGGLATGGGTLDVDETITVTAASAADALTGTAADRALTPKSLGDNTSAAANGYIKLPGGLIMQWGGITTTGPEGQHNVNFPIPFPNNCFRVVLTGVNATAGAARDIWPQLVSKSTAGFIAWWQWAGDGNFNTNTLDGMEFWAIGN
jgi:hypothetical protein